MNITINKRKIGPWHPVYIIAEMSANHGQSLKKALKIIAAAKDAGANAVKTQTYTADTMTINCRNKYFQIKGTIWEGKNLYDLYQEAATPWEWQPELKVACEKLGLDFFSTPFDATSVDFLEKIRVPAYKVASFELVDIPLLKKIASTGKPIIMSTGMATRAEINEAVKVIFSSGNHQLALLKCSSSYPADPSMMNLKTIMHLSKIYKMPIGLSDHTLGSAVSVASVALGACIVEKHFTLSRKDGGADSAFSMEPFEFKSMVSDIRIAEKAIGTVSYQVTDREKESRAFRRSIFVVKDIRKGELFSEKHIRSIRPGHGMHPRFLGKLLGQKAARDIRRGTPLSDNLIEGEILDGKC